jgi:hypothetical protein
MHHDLAAELRGYHAELASAEQAEDTDRADAVRAEIGRVHAALARAAEIQLAHADGYDASNQGVVAAQHRRRAAELAGHVPASALPESLRHHGISDQETTEDTTPRETAVTRRAKSNKET